jgi:hypothetical protein
MCPLLRTNWVFISQKTAFFIVAAVETPNFKDKDRIYTMIQYDPPKRLPSVDPRRRDSS